jgi:predicted anti-sigma-YlaC factor YlaD
MLSCKDMVRSASDYLDGRLTWRQRIMLGLHLVMCAFCRRFFKQFKLACDTASHPAQQLAEDHDVAKVMQQIDRES